MSLRKAGQIFSILAACAWLAGCGLPQSDKSDAQQVVSTVERYQHFVRDARLTIASTGFPKDPDLNSTLDKADRHLDELVKSGVQPLRAALAKDSVWNGSDVAGRVGACIPILDEIRSALEPIQRDLSDWKNLRSDPGGYILNHKASVPSSMPHFGPVRALVQKAMSDWPDKRTFLEQKLQAFDKEAADDQSRAGTLADILENASRWDLKAEQALFLAVHSGSDWTKQLETNGSALELLAKQLYVGRDRILEDLDPDNEEGPRAKFRAITMIVEDAPSHVWKRDFSDEWVPVPDEDTWNSYKNRIGMSFERKPPGKFDSETERLPEPAEMAYLSPTDQDRNQFGYWSSNISGEREWHWFEQYLLLSLLLNHNSTVTSRDYQDFRRVSSAGTTWFGKDAATGQAKYGTYGTNLVAGQKSTGYRNSRFSAATDVGTFRNSSFASAGGTFRNSRYASAAVGSSPTGSFDKSSGMSFSGSSSGRGFFGSSSGLSFGSARSSPSAFSSSPSAFSSSRSSSVSSSGRSFGGGRR